MSTLPSYFNDFLAKIRLTKNQIEECQTGHKTLRERLKNDEKLKEIIVADFLQGSYKRSTAIRPFEDKSKSDVDIIIVTNLDRAKFTPRQALDLFVPFLEDKYKGKYREQGRSWGIELSYVKMDLVPTSAPYEAMAELVKSASLQSDQSLEELGDWNLGAAGQSGMAKGLAEKTAGNQWRREPLWIPDRDVQQWDKTHPLAQIDATKTKNASSSGHFVNVVRCLKWWRTTQQPEPKYPKSYPLEHLCWVNCPDRIASIAEGVVMTLESICDRYLYDAQIKKIPIVPDHGVPDHNVLGRVSGDDFAAFHKHVSDAASQARRAYDELDARRSASLWRELFGDRFPEPPEKGDDDEGGSPDKPGGYTPRKEASKIGGGRFAM